ncbi:MAG: PHP domain-containing protein [Bacillota bacterium]
MRWYAADLHIHSALSPCAGHEMTPGAIVQALSAASVHLAAVTDHNSCENAAAFLRACRAQGIAGLVGMELETREEVHLLCLFDCLEAGMNWQEHVYQRLPWRENDERVFGSQLRFGAEGNPAGHVRRLLALSTDIALEEACAQVEARGGMCIPAHIDRPAYGLLGMLGMVPGDLPVPALEISATAREEEVRGRAGGGLGARRLVSFSDAHHLGQIVPVRTVFYVARPVLPELRLALAGRDGRRVVVFE